MIRGTQHTVEVAYHELDVHVVMGSHEEGYGASHVTAEDTDQKCAWHPGCHIIKKSDR
jgi:hypothetical protein